MKANIFALLMLAEGIAGHAIQRTAGTQGAQNGQNGQNGQDQQVSDPESCKPTGKAVYLITNDAQNAVVALPISADGTLEKGTITPSGGKGSIALDAKGQPATPDALVSQSALTIAGGFLFTVNAGSNSVSMLSIDKRDPTKLAVVGKPAEVPGEFPSTVAASAKNKLTCVATTGAKAGISCASFSKNGIGSMDGLRAIDLGQTTPPVGPTNTVSHTFFSEDESTLFTMVKGDPGANKTGFLSSLPIEQKKSCSGANAAAAAQKDSRVSPPGTAVLFGSQVIPGTNTIFATDASFGATVLSVDEKSGQAQVVRRQTIDGQKATCWAAFSKATGSVFVTDVAFPRIIEMSAKDASIISTIDLSAAGDPGFIDLQAAGDFLYALSPGNGTTDAAIAVVDLSAGQGQAKAIQRFSLKGISGKNSQGIAVLN
ncbi:hypothetical protein F5Y04DRAFT_279670 [Hypomontagnella monticulosa]|nr:hypothetical protein F5Y04DRAFT_279670 [Hypomontagnella monticulosa]